MAPSIGVTRVEQQSGRENREAATEWRHHEGQEEAVLSAEVERDCPAEVGGGNQYDETCSRGHGNPQGVAILIYRLY